MSRTFRTSKKNDRHFNYIKKIKKYYKRKVRRNILDENINGNTYNKYTNISHEL